MANKKEPKITTQPSMQTFQAPLVRISIFAANLILNIVAATQIFRFYNYVTDLEIKKTGFGLFPGLFIILLVPAMIFVYPVVLLIHIGFVGYYWDQSKEYKAIFLLWVFMLLMYVPALLAWSEC